MNAVPWWFIIPAVALYGFIVLWPALQGSTVAFTDWDGLNPDRDWVGAANFERAWNDSAARTSIGNTLLFAVSTTVLSNVIGLGLALLVRLKLTVSSTARALFFIPAIFTPLITTFVWQFVLAPQGALNRLLEGVGLGELAQPWLASAPTAIVSVIVVVAWHAIGTSMVLYLAGLEGVPQEVLEAASVDGAGPVRRFFSVTFPLIAPAATIAVVLNLISSLKVFDQVIALTQGGPGYATETLSTIIYKRAFQFGEFGYAAALALILTAIVAVLALTIYRRLARREVVQ